jgi:hypothetical protein
MLAESSGFYTVMQYPGQKLGLYGTPLSLMSYSVFGLS